jgi:hypothetical protein
MQIAMPGEYEAADFEDTPRNRGFRFVPLEWKTFEKDSIGV